MSIWTTAVMAVLTTRRVGGNQADDTAFDAVQRTGLWVPVENNYESNRFCSF
jgi:hypothetical protein